jgi:hypothetical protein
MNMAFSGEKREYGSKKRKEKRDLCWPPLTAPPQTDELRRYKEC